MDKGRQMGLAATIAVVTGESIALGIFLTPAAMARSLGSDTSLRSLAVRRARFPNKFHCERNSVLWLISNFRKGSLVYVARWLFGPRRRGHLMIWLKFCCMGRTRLLRENAS